METKQIIATLENVEEAKMNNPDFVTWNDEKPLSIRKNETDNLIEVEMEGELWTYDDEDELSITSGVLTVWIDQDGFDDYLEQIENPDWDKLYNEDIFNMKWEDFYWESDDERQNDEEG